MSGVLTRPRRSKKRMVVVGVGMPLLLAMIALLALYAIAVDLASPPTGPVYSVAQVQALLLHQRHWGGRIVTVRGVATQPSADGFVLLDHYPALPSAALWVSADSGHWRIEAMLWARTIARAVPGMGWLSIERHPAVYRIRLPRLPCTWSTLTGCPCQLVK